MTDHSHSFYLTPFSFTHSPFQVPGVVQFGTFCVCREELDGVFPADSSECREGDHRVFEHDAATFLRDPHILPRAVIDLQQSVVREASGSGHPT